MSQPELLRYTVAALEAAGVAYMVTGSTVSSLQGQPRMTHDIDIVVAIEPSSIPALLAAFRPPRFYLEEAAIRDAIATGAMFNVIDVGGGDKVDFWMLKTEPFEQSMFARRYQESAAGIAMYVSQPEDTILSKLKWARASDGSSKQIADCVAVYEVNHTNLDLEYLKGWAHELGVSDLLAQVEHAAEV